MSEYRMVYYDHDERRNVVLPSNEAEDDSEYLGELLDHYVESGYATGGHIEQYLGDEIGWVVELEV